MRFRYLPAHPFHPSVFHRGTSILTAAGLLGLVTFPVQARGETTDEDKKTERKEQQTAPKASATDAFELGQITVYGKRDGGDQGGRTLSQSRITAEDLRIQNRNTLDDALRTTPGVESSNSGGARNERMIHVRGFDRFQVPLSIDGVRVYLPADNRLDYGRFLTPDLAEIQIHKGYASVLDGPGGMGGSINLVTRKPTRDLEGEISATTEFGNTGDLAAHVLSGSVGTKQELFYLQASASLRDSDGYHLSRDYEPENVATGGPVQGKGRRDYSKVKDWRINLKAALTPNATDEYAISHTYQQGEKSAPYHVGQPVRGITPAPLPGGSAYRQDWTWPEWNISTTSFNSHTRIGEESYVRTKLYYNRFENLLSTFDDRTHGTQTSTRAFDSHYDDFAYGMSLEAGTELIPLNTLKTALHYRRDAHRRWQYNSPGSPAATKTPFQRRTEDTWSLAIEDTFHATDTLDVVGGLSYDWYETLEAENFDKNVFGEYPLFDNDAINWQTAVVWRPAEGTDVYAGISNRTRFPTLFDRYSTRFGDANPSPDLKPERAINYQIGGNRELFDGALRVGAAVFYSDIEDAIQAVPVGGGLVQNQNVGNGETYGFEISGEWDVSPALTLGGNYTYLHRNVDDPQRPDLRPVGTPEQLAYLYGHWRPVEKLTITPSVELSDSRWSSNRFEDAFHSVPGFSLFNLNVEYQFTRQASVSVGIRNIFDKNYELADGYPEPGRTFHLTTRITF